MKIDKHIPYASAGAFKSARGSYRSVYPFREMEIGDSVFYAGDFKHLNDSRAYMAAKTIQKHSDVIMFQGKRTEENGVKGIRIWRTA